MELSALRKIGYGLYIISSIKDGMLNGQVANAVMQVSSDPIYIAACINKKNLTHEYIKHSRVFSVSILSQSTPLKFIGRFGFRSGREINKFEGIEYITGKTGSPVVTENVVAYLEARVEKEVSAGSHTIFVGRVENADVLDDTPPMSYAYYHEVRGGKTQKNAPTFIEG